MSRKETKLYDSDGNWVGVEIKETLTRKEAQEKYPCLFFVEDVRPESLRGGKLNIKLNLIVGTICFSWAAIEFLFTGVATEGLWPGHGLMGCVAIFIWSIVGFAASISWIECQ